MYKSLSEQLHAQVTKHDMPGFGLTLRPKDLSGYTLDYNGRLGRYVMDAELAAAGVLNPADVKSGLAPPANLTDLQSVSEDFQSGQPECEPAPNTAVLQAAAAKRGVSKSSKQQPESPTSSLDFPSSMPDTDSNTVATSHTREGKRIRRVLVGHSVGAACAAAEYINNPKVSGAVGVNLCVSKQSLHFKTALLVSCLAFVILIAISGRLIIASRGTHAIVSMLCCSKVASVAGNTHFSQYVVLVCRILMALC